jgi:hypothetical protein
MKLGYSKQNFECIHCFLGPCYIPRHSKFPQFDIIDRHIYLHAFRSYRSNSVPLRQAEVSSNKVKSVTQQNVNVVFPNALKRATRWPVHSQQLPACRYLRTARQTPGTAALPQSGSPFVIAIQTTVCVYARTHSCHLWLRLLGRTHFISSIATPYTRGRPQTDNGNVQDLCNGQEGCRTAAACRVVLATRLVTRGTSIQHDYLFPCLVHTIKAYGGVEGRLVPPQRCQSKSIAGHPLY